MSQQNHRSIDDAYRAFTSGDIEAFLGLLPDDFRSTQSEAVPWRGTYLGASGVREMFAQVSKCAEARFTPNAVIDAGDTMVVPGTATITTTGTPREFSARELHVWTLANGQLRSLDVFLNATAELLAALERAAAPTVAGTRTQGDRP